MKDAIEKQWRIQDFPHVGAPTPKVDVKSYYFANFPQKLHEIERIWTAASVPGAPKISQWKVSIFVAAPLSDIFSRHSPYKLIINVARK